MKRTTELRLETIEFDEAARQFITDSIAFDGQLNVIANKRQAGDKAEYADKEYEQRGLNPVPGPADVIFLEVEISDPSAFSHALRVEGVEVDGYRALRVKSPAVPNAIAAVLLAMRDSTGTKPQCYFEWAEGNPVGHLMRYLFLGQGDTAPLVREILRTVEPDPALRPAIHVG